jgi:CBS domain-containing protein
MMKVKDICSRRVVTCSPDMDLAAVISLMWDFDLGSVPVVDLEGRIAGMITDRDVAIALGTRNRPASDVRAGEAMSTRVHSCAPDDDLRAAMNTMWTHKIRRLPVVNSRGAVVGMLSINDLILRAQVSGLKESAGPGWEDVLLTMKGICSPRSPGPHSVRPSPALKV